MRLLAVLTALTLMLPVAAIAAPDLEKQVQRILKKTPLIDGHNDIPWQYRRRVNNHLDQMDLHDDLTQLTPPTHTDMARLKQGMVGGQFWSVYVPVTELGGKPKDFSLVAQQIDLVHRMVDRYDEFEMAYTAADVRRIHRRGKLASMIGMEGGHAIDNSLANLRMLYELGARYMTLTHGKSLQWADSSNGDGSAGGLSEFGLEVIREMNRLGMLVDLSHVSPETMMDALNVTVAPVIFSHSSAYTITPHTRNVPDDVLLKVKENGGVVMVTFFPWYVSEPLRQHRNKANEFKVSLEETVGEDAVAERMKTWHIDHPAPKPTLEQVATHIDHIRNLIGAEHIGLGGDYDGMPPGPVGLEDVGTYPNLLVELLRRGYSKKEVAGIAGDNVLRVMTEAENVARQLQKTVKASDKLIEELDQH